MAVQAGRDGVRKLGVCLVAALLLAACGEGSPEAQLADAREDLQRARQDVAAAEARYEEATRELEKARAKRDEALEALQAARARREQARAEVGRFATDDAIFRSVQKRLLDDKKLSEVAIPVRVNDGVVVLTGEVPEDSMAKRAEELAAEVAGVVEVRSRIRVQGDEAEGSSQKSAKPERAGEQGGGGPADGGAEASGAEE